MTRRAMLTDVVNPTTKGEHRESEQAMPAAAEERPLAFSKPWRIGEFGDVVTADGNIVVDPFGSTLEYLGPHAEREYMRHIVACVNACDGISTEDLERASGLMAWVRPQ